MPDAPPLPRPETGLLPLYRLSKAPATSRTFPLDGKYEAYKPIVFKDGRGGSPASALKKVTSGPIKPITKDGGVSHIVGPACAGKKTAGQDGGVRPAARAGLRATQTIIAPPRLAQGGAGGLFRASGKPGSTPGTPEIGPARRRAPILPIVRRAA